MDSTLWYPRISVPEMPENCGNEKFNDNIKNNEPHHKHKRRKGTKIERRCEATVDVTTALSRNDSPPEDNSAGYATIEDSSFVGLEKFENWKESDHTSCIRGWKNDENIARMVLHRPYDNSLVINESRSALQSREVSDRLYSSRLNTQMSKRRDQYKFTHANSPSEHLQNYSESCSYSHLIFCTRRRPKSLLANDEEDTDFTEEAVQVNKKERETILPKTVTTSTVRPKHNRPTLKQQQQQHNSSIPPIPLITIMSNSTDRVLHTLADRLGVKESIDEPKLLCNPVRPTPPSIARRKIEIREDLFLFPDKKKCNEVSSSKSMSNPSQPSQSRPDTKLSKERRTPHQLPRIHRKQNPSTSSISLSKYFHINTNNKKHDHIKQDETEEGEDTVPTCSQSNSLVSIVSSESLERDSADCEDMWPRFVTTDHRLSGSVINNKEAIRRKADSLGLLSHKWAKNFIERGFMNGAIPRKLYYNYSRQSTTDTTTTATSTISTRARTTATTRARTTATTTTTARNRIQQKLLSTKQNEKMQELRELYANGRKSRTSSKVMTNKSENIASHSIDHHHKSSNNKSRQPVSRPPTRSKSVFDRKTTQLRSHEQQKLNTSGTDTKFFQNKEFQLHGLIQRISTRS